LVTSVLFVGGPVGGRLRPIAEPLPPLVFIGAPAHPDGGIGRVVHHYRLNGDAKPVYVALGHEGPGR
jgi:hypothetical protein